MTDTTDRPGEPAADTVARVVEVIVDPIPLSDMMALTTQWETKHGSGLALVPGRWTRMVVVTPGKRCGCFSCYHQEAQMYQAATGNLPSSMFIVCETCGNKRCPRAEHHDNACTNSNEPGQPGSSYPPIPG